MIGQAPATFLIAALLAMGAAYAAASWRFGGIIETQQAQIALLERKIAAVPGGVDHEKRKATMDALGKFLSDGNAIMGNCRQRDRPPPKDEAEIWLRELTDFLQENLGTAYVARVNDGGSAPVGFMSQYREHDTIYNAIRVRVYHLQEFLKEMSR